MNKAKLIREFVVLVVILVLILYIFGEKDKIVPVLIALFFLALVVPATLKALQNGSLQRVISEIFEAAKEHDRQEDIRYQERHARREQEREHQRIQREGQEREEDSISREAYLRRKGELEAEKEHKERLASEKYERERDPYGEAESAWNDYNRRMKRFLKD